jgi:hypothetical protein
MTSLLIILILIAGMAIYVMNEEINQPNKDDDDTDSGFAV